MVTDSGYTLALDTAQVPAGADVPLRFRILDADGTPVTRYVDSHDKQLHLIACAATWPDSSTCTRYSTPPGPGVFRSI